MLFLPGTRLTPQDYTLFAGAAADLGFHVLSLDWPNWGCRPPSGVPTCMNASLFVASDACTETCYRAPLLGEFPPPSNASGPNPNGLTAHDGLLHRAECALQHLARGDSSWRQFLVASANAIAPPSVHWARVISAGHSLGADMATFIAKRFAVERLVALAGVNSFVRQWPDEAERVRGVVATPAAWVRRPGATPPERLWSFGDLHGRVCPLWSPAQITQKLPGVARRVEWLPGANESLGTPPPVAAMRGLHKLCAGTCWHNRSVMTRHGGSNGSIGVSVHVSDHSAVAMDCCTPLMRGDGGGWVPLYQPVWRHMLTSSTSESSETDDDGNGAAMAGAAMAGGECGCLSYP